MNKPLQLSPCPECGGTGRKKAGPDFWIPCSACRGRSPSPNPPPANSSAGANIDQTVFLLLSIFVICSFVWRVTEPGFEFPSRMEQLTTIAVDLVCVVCLICWKTRIFREIPGQTGWSKLLCSIALVAGLGLLAIRLNGNASWWTGHLFQVNRGNDGFLHR